MIKIVKQIEFEGAWGELQAEGCLQGQYGQDILYKLWFSCGVAHYLMFFMGFLLVLAIFFLGGGGGWALGHNSMRFQDFPDIS